MMECFNSLLLKLREAHEREVEGWQIKIQELSNKKGCDTRRMEELFSKNQQMKEQQRFLTENIKTLENRLRAGLCDRCTVTQELAKRRQQEFEASQVQSLQHLSLMAGEMNNLKKENRRLKEELKGLKAALQRVKPEEPDQTQTQTQNQNQNPHLCFSSSTEHKPNTSPDLSPPSGPMPLVATATSKSSQQPADGEGVRKTEVDQRKEGADHRPWRSSNKRYFDSYKPLSIPTRKLDHGSSSYGGEKRPAGAEVLDQQTFSGQPLLLKSSGGGEVTPSRHVLHAPLPCRPQPIKGSPGSLPWSSPPASSLMRSPSHKPNMPPFPTLASAEGLLPGLVSIWHKQGPKPNSPEQTVLFRLRSLPEHMDRKSLEKKENLACWTERASREGPREAFEGPLDLSDPGKSTSNESPADYSSISSGDIEPTQDNPGGHLKVDDSPSPSPKPPHSQQEEDPAPDFQTQVGQGPEPRKDTPNGTTEPSSDKKVPVLTISLRPVVVLETLDPAFQKQDSLSPNEKSSAAEPENSQQEQNSDREGNQSCKRKRSAAVSDSDQDINHIHQERKVKIAMATQEKSS